MHITVHVYRNLIVRSVMGGDDTSVGSASVTLVGRREVWLWREGVRDRGVWDRTRVYDLNYIALN